MVFGIAERDARADRKEPVVAFARDIVGADSADPTFMTAEALAPFGADAERGGKIGLREAARFDGEADHGQVGADEIGRASCGERVCQDVLISVVYVSLNKKAKCIPKSKTIA